MKWIKWGLGVLVALLLLLQIAPYIIRDQAVIWLRQQGAEDVGLRALKLKWWEGRIEVDRLHAEADGRLPLNVGRLTLDIDIPALFDRHLLVSELSLADAESGIRLKDDQLWLGPVNLTALPGEPAPPQEEESKAAAPLTWRFGIDRFRIDRFNWATELPNQNHRLELELGELDELYQWRDREQSRLRLQGKLNGAPFDIDTRVVPLPVDKRSDMQLTLQGFPVESVTAAFVPGLSAELSFALSLSGELNGADGRVRPKGRIVLDKVRYQSDGLDIDNQLFSWEGEIDLELKGLLPHQLNMKGDIALEPLSLKQADALAVELQKFGWNGDLALSFDSAALPQALTMNAAIELQQPDISQASGLEAGLEQLSWNGDLELTFTSGALPQALSMNAALDLQQPGVRQTSGLDAGMDALNWKGDLGLAFASGAPANLDLDGQLALAGNRIALPEVVAGTLASLDWQGRLDLSLAGGAPQRLGARGKLGLGDTRMQLPDTGDIGLRQGRWEGNLDLAFADGQPQELTLDGDLALDNQQLQLAAAKLESSLTSLGWTGSLKLQLPKAGPELELNGSVKASGGKAVAPDFNASLGELSWQGNTRLVQQSLSAKGEIAASTLAFSQPMKLDASLDSVSSSLQLSSPDLAVFDATIPLLSVQSISAKAGKGSYPLASLKSLELEALNLKASQNLALKRLNLGGLEVARAGKQPLTAVGQIRVSDVTFEKDKRAAASSLWVSDSNSLIRLDKEGLPVDINVLLAVLDEISSGDTADTAGTAAQSGGKEDDGLAWKLDRLEFEGKNRMRFEDGSTDPVFTSNVDISRFHVERLGSLITEPSPFELNARINDFSELDAGGALNLIGGVSDGQWQATLKGVELPALSPYSIRYTGYYIDSGQLHVEAEGTVSDRQLAGTNHIRLNRVAVKRVDAKRSAELEQQLSMPLETALAVLQDDDQNIELDVPISGSLDSPDFGYQSIINIVVEKGVKTAAMGFLTSALQPYGALITLAGMAADASRTGSAIELEPVVFEPGSAELDATARDYLNKIAGMLKEREGLRLNLCGQSVIRDRTVLAPLLAEEQQDADEPLDEAGVDAELKKRLQALADSRAAVVKDYLDDQVESDRLFLCFSRLALNEAEAQPAVFLGL